MAKKIIYDRGPVHAYKHLKIGWYVRFMHRAGASITTCKGNGV